MSSVASQKSTRSSRTLFASTLVFIRSTSHVGSTKHILCVMWMRCSRSSCAPGFGLGLRLLVLYHNIYFDTSNGRECSSVYGLFSFSLLNSIMTHPTPCHVQRICSPSLCRMTADRLKYRCERVRRVFRSTSYFCTDFRFLFRVHACTLLRYYVIRRVYTRAFIATLPHCN